MSIYKKIANRVDKFTTWVGDVFETFGSWGTDNFEILSTGLSVALMFFILIIVGCFVLGYFLNGLFGYKFAIDSVWQGVTAVAAGIATLYNMNKNHLDKYKIDSELNSEKGKAPDFLRKRGNKN